MDIKETYSFDAPIDRVWALMLDPDSLAHCMPGCEKLVTVDDGRYEATLSVGVGAIKGSYAATITIADVVPMRSYKMLVEGAGSSGFVRGEAFISVSQEGNKTLVKVDGTAQIGGMVARVGQRLIGSVNKMMMDRFFTCLQESATELPS